MGRPIDGELSIPDQPCRFHLNPCGTANRPGIGPHPSPLAPITQPGQRLEPEAPAAGGQNQGGLNLVPDKPSPFPQ